MATTVTMTTTLTATKTLAITTTKITTPAALMSGSPPSEKRFP